MDKKEVKGIADQEVRKHEKGMHKGSKPTKFAKGGATTVTNEAMKRLGSNRARAENQRGR